MKVIGNFLWFILGGIFMGVSWWIVGIACFMTVIGIPWGRACFVMAQFSFFPFGKEAISRKILYGKDDIGTGASGIVGNIIWFVFPGWLLALANIFWAICCFICSIFIITAPLTIPFGIQYLKLAGISLFPIGQMIVDKEVATEARKQNAIDIVNEARKY